MSTLELVRSGEALVGIIGMGYVGLPLARAFGKAGLRVIGFDIDPDKVERLGNGSSYIKHIPSSDIRHLLDSGRFEATADFDRLSEPDCILICVPTPLSVMHDPDLSYVCSTAQSIAKRLREGQLVVLESTTYPGTTREEVVPELEASGLAAGEDFYVAYSPEREDPGNPDYTVETIPKVVGGINSASLQVAAALYGQVSPNVIKVSSTDAAEATKILENIYRAVNIALVNELKILFDRMEIDVWEVIGAAASKPFGYHPFYPGPGWGGHCIPIDPFYLSWKARQFGLKTHFIERAGEINTFMTEFVRSKIARALNDDGKPIRGSKILVVGVAYKKDVDDIRESPALPLISMLASEGADLSYHDPHIGQFPSLRSYPGLKMRSVKLTSDVLREQDCVVVVTDHSACDFDYVRRNARLIVDTRNAVPPGSDGGRVVKA